jgi:predicted nuclease with TOPRIM domain
MTPLQEEIEDIKDALASIEENGERRVGEAEQLLARLAALEKELARFIDALPAPNNGRAG